MFLQKINPQVDDEMNDESCSDNSEMISDCENDQICDTGYGMMTNLSGAKGTKDFICSIFQYYGTKTCYT